jgi:hypothetical protein
MQLLCRKLHRLELMAVTKPIWAGLKDILWRGQQQKDERLDIPFEDEIWGINIGRGCLFREV